MPRRAALSAFVLFAGFLPAEAMAQLRACRPVAVVRPVAPTGTSLDNPALEPVPANPVQCRQGVSLKVDGAVIWRCQAIPPDGEDLPEGAPEYAFLIERPGQPLQVLPDDLMAGRHRSFDVISVDLDGDGTPERVLAAWNSQGNGLGVNRWTIRVFDRDWKLIATLPDVSDWGDTSIVRASAGRRGCDIAVTSFVDSVDGQGRAGISFQARFHRLGDGRMEEATDRPALARRYTFAFQRQRTRHFDRTETQEKGDIAAWLASARPATPR
jgi:hypothetical protein